MTSPVRHVPQRTVPNALVVGRAALAGAVVTVAAYATSHVLPLGPLVHQVAEAVAYPLGFGFAAATAAAAARRSTTLATTWWTLCAALGLYGLGDLLFSVFPDVELGGLAVADLSYLASYGLLAALPLLVVRAAGVRPHISIWLDGATCGLGVLSVVAAVVLSPAWWTRSADTSLAVGYLVADAVLLALLGSLASILGRAGVLVVGALAVAGLFVGDLSYYRAVDLGSYLPGGLPDLVYFTLPLLLAGLAHRAPAAWRSTADLSRPRLSVSTQLFPLAGATAALAVLLWSSVEPVGTVATALAGACLLVAAAAAMLTLRAVRSFYELRTQAVTDQLTGIGNRRALDAAVTRMLAAGTDGSTVAVLVVDLDSFSDVNDDAGHAAGDEVLRQMAARLGADVPVRTTVTRLEGDTFALALPGADAETARQAAEDAVARLRQPVHLGTTRVRLTASIGVAVGRAGRIGPADLVRRADEALREAKRRRQAVVVHEAEEHAAQEVSRLQLADELHTAIAEGQLVVWLQPQLHLAPAGPGASGGRVTTVAGCEALVRWEHPDRGLLGPGHVLGAAEHGRLMPLLSETVLALSLAAAATWWERCPVPVSVNLSATDLDDATLPDRVFRLLLVHRLPPWALTVEVVEDTLMLDPERARDVLGRLREMGVTISIDDYGTGYSSLAYLHELPVDELKLDRSLTRDLAVNPSAAAIARHSIALAHDLGLTVVGEGVEEPEVLDELVALGCDTVQGYLTGKPMPTAAWLTWLDEQTALPAVAPTLPATEVPAV